MDWFDKVRIYLKIFHCYNNVFRQHFFKLKLTFAFTKIVISGNVYGGE